MKYFFCLLAIFATFSLKAQNLIPLSQGTLSVGGRAQIPIEVIFEGQSTVAIKLQPSLSYFLKTNWEINIAPLIDFRFVPIFPRANRYGWGAQINTRYYLPISERVSAYGGLGIGSKIFELDKTTWRGLLALEGGILLALAKNIALDFGLPIETTLNSISGFEKVTLLPGYIGVRAFF